ncbi:MAG TPA: beta-ketoacyl-ACP synthase 3, partial [Burkholderiales bacterium]
MYSYIAGTGSYLPERVLTNAELERMVNTSDEWIRTRSGIRERRIAAEGQVASDLALEAARRALAAAQTAPSELDLVIVATTTPDMVFPSTACILQSKLGIANHSPAFDVQAVCSGFIYALATADLFVKAGMAKCALVAGAELYSRILDWKDRGTCVLFGDGAGAVVLKASAAPGILSSHLHADGSHHGILSVPGQIYQGGVQGRPFVHMDGSAVFRFAVRVLAEVAEEALAAN